MKLRIDFETYSELDLTVVGAVAYAEHPSTRILMMGYKEYLEEPKLWVPGDAPVQRRYSVLTYFMLTMPCLSILYGLIAVKLLACLPVLTYLALSILWLCVVNLLILLALIKPQKRAATTQSKAQAKAS